ncbi:DNA-binding protein [Pandoraea apista]|nr:DNA-binding protein [Pandoraea apista]AJE99225.2 DNA-binding protein [Pandoraea apista]AKH73330.1 DNA-binding protein [Pandoraea apista]AKI61876.1 DNA-binding protein [Pandoraea apista]ALS64996.1 DNA-binding protein [Pandoraea apista]
MTSALRSITVGVMGSGKQPWTELAAPLGRALAIAGYHLLTGGGQGVMASVSEAFCAVPQRMGRSIGVVPTEAVSHDGERPTFRPLAGYPNPFVEVPIVSPLPRHLPDAPAGTLSRNHINVLSSDVIVALPGNHGTRDEVGLALHYGKPVILFGQREHFADMPASLVRTVSLDTVMDFVRTAR